MDVTEITVKSALVRSKIPGVEYVINPYLGCAHGCRYCYAVFMRKYARHHRADPWGSFVEVKVNIAEVLRRELAKKKKPGRVMLASVCDPYQPVEARYRLTRQCLEALIGHSWGVSILTKSPLVTRDLDLLKDAPDVSVGFSIGTDDERVRAILEPQAPPIAARIEALRQLHEAGVRTWVFVAPILPLDPERLFAAIAPHMDSFMADGLNYAYLVRDLYRKHGWEYALTPAYADEMAAFLLKKWEERGG